MKSFKEIKIKELILHNFGLKILAIVIAIVSWIVIVNVDNPSQRKTISGITVNMINGDALTSKGYIYQIESGASISIVVKAPQTIVDELKSTDFYAYADLSERTPDADRAQIYVRCTKEGMENTVDIVSLRTEYVQLAIDNKIDKEVPLEMNITGSPADGYVIGDYSISPTTIKVTGAESTVSRISTARLNYSVSSMTATINDSVVPVFYDENGVEISSDKLELSRNSASIQIEILPTKVVDINYALSGEVAEGYHIVDEKVNMKNVKLAASKDVLDKITSIDIPAGIIDIDNADDDRHFDIALKTYLPNGCKIVSSESNLTVDVTIEKISERTIQIPMSQVTISGTESDYRYQLVADNGSGYLNVIVNGSESDIGALTADDLGARIDMSGKGEGSYTVKVNLNQSDDYSISGSYYVKVIVTDMTLPDNPTQPEETTGAETEADTAE